MAIVTNKTARAIHIGNTVLVPGVPTEISDSFMGHRRVKSMVDARFLEAGASPSADQRMVSEAEKKAEEERRKAEAAQKVTSQPIGKK